MALKLRKFPGRPCTDAVPLAAASTVVLSHLTYYYYYLTEEQKRTLSDGMTTLADMFIDLLR